MKQTKSAITFLMAQYRSIFSKAYLKGLVPAIALTAGLAAVTNASAATVSGGDAWDSPATGTVTEGSTHDSSKNYFTDLNINSGSLTVTNSKSADGVFVQGTLKVGKGTTLTVGNGETKGTILNFDGDNSSSGSLDSYGTIKMSGTSVSSQIQMTNVTLRSGSITTIQSSQAPTDWDGNSQLVAGISAPGAFNIESGATVNLNDYSQIVTGKDSTMAINGTVNLTAKAASSNAFIRAADIYDGDKTATDPKTGTYSAGRTNGTITIGSTGKIIVNSGSGNAGLFAAEVTINGTNNTNTIEVQDGGKLALNGDMISKDVTFANAKYAAGQFNMASGKIYVAQGGTLEIGAGKYKNDNTETAVDETTLTTTLSINGGSLDTYGTVNVSGTLSVSQSGALNFQADGKLNVTGSAKVNQNGTINVLNNSILSGAGTLEVAQNGTINIKSGANLSVSGTLSLAAGSSLNNQGTLTLSANGKTLVDVANINHIDDLGTVVNSGTITFITTDTKANIFNIDGQEDLSLLLNNDNSAYQGTIILTGTTLESSNALTLSQKELTQFQGSSGSIHAEEVTYKVGTNENLQGVTVFGDTLTFTNEAGTGDVTVSGSQATQNFVTYNLGANADSSLLVSGNAAIKMVNQGNADQSGSITTALTVSGGSLTVSDLEVKASKDITVAAGTLTVSGSKFTTALDIDGQLNLTETGSNVDVTNGSLSLKSINVTNGSLEVTNGTLSIKGDGSGGSNGTVDIIGGDKIKVTTGQLNFGDANDTVKLSLSNNASGTWSVDQTYSGSKIKIDGATVQVDVSKALGQETTSLSINAANTLLGYLVSGTGLVDLGSTKVELPTPDKNGELTAESIADDAGNITVSFENDQTKDIIVTDLKGTITGGWEGVKTAGTNNPVQVAANAKFAIYGNASGENIVTDSTGKVVGLTLGKASTTELSSTGLVGKIDGSSGDLILTDSANITVVNTSDTTKKDNVIVKQLAGTGTLNAADIKTTDTALKQGAVVSAANYTVQTSGSFAVNGATVAVTETLDLTDVDIAKGPAQTSGSLITAKVVEVSEAAFNDGSVVSGETLSGSTGSDVTASASTLNFKTAELENLSLVDDAEAFFETLEIKNNGVLAVGSDSGENTTASSAKAQIQSLKLDGGLLQVDPSFNQPTAMVTIDSFTSGITDTNYETSPDDVGLADGSIFVGQNSAVGLGVKTLNELQSVISKYQVGSALDQDKYGAVLYVDGALQLANGYGITLTSQSLTAFEASRPSIFNGSNVLANAIYFGRDTALIINGDNLKDDQAFIIIDGDSTDATPSKLIAAGGEVVINGDVKAGKTTIFKTNDTDKLQVTTTDNKAGGSILVTTENNLLQGSITNDSTGFTDGSVDLRVNEEEAETIINAASAPVLETILAYGRGYNGEPDADGNVAAENYLYDLDRKGNKIDYNNYFLQQELIRGNGSSTEKVARLGIYGGTAQAALSAGATTHESVSARMGMGAQNSSLTFADNGQGAGLWLNPIYKSHDSDGFATQGLSYGVDMSMYGLALGGDFTMANGLRVGAAFNLGSGDADGQGFAAGVSNDFDYYGFTVYGGFSQGPISVVGDISYTVVDNSVDANTAFEQVHTSLDSANLSVGVTGQYAMNFNGTSITPHAGLRYTKIDLDDYVVKGSADIAEYNGDSMSVFSVPVGVTVAKDFTAGSWTIKPSFDLTLTANMGDDSIGGSVDWAGVENLKTNLDSEVLDSFTYGATLGVAAKSGNFSLGLGVNYTGASNADEYGVQANARFVF